MPLILTGTPYTVTARVVISDALTFGLNRLSPGESIDADLAEVCLNALNSIVDEWNGTGLLYRTVFTTSGAISGSYGTLGVNWAGLGGGEQILGATIRYGSSEDVELSPLTMAQYAVIGDKTTSGVPEYYAHDGAALVYLYPVATGQSITLRTLQPVSDFSDLDTEYSMPKGYRSALAALLAEKMAPSLGAASPFVTQQARAARQRLMNQAIKPAIVLPHTTRPSILQGY